MDSPATHHQRQRHHPADFSQQGVTTPVAPQPHPPVTFRGACAPLLDDVILNDVIAGMIQRLRPVPFTFSFQPWKDGHDGNRSTENGNGPPLAAADVPSCCAPSTSANHGDSSPTRGVSSGSNATTSADFQPWKDGRDGNHNCTGSGGQTPAAAVTPGCTHSMSANQCDSSPARGISSGSNATSAVFQPWKNGNDGNRRCTENVGQPLASAVIFCAPPTSAQLGESSPARGVSSGSNATSAYFQPWKDGQDDRHCCIESERQPFATAVSSRASSMSANHGDSSPARSVSSGSNATSPYFQPWKDGREGSRSCYSEAPENVILSSGHENAENDISFSSHEAPEKVILSSSHESPEKVILSSSHEAPEKVILSSSHEAPEKLILSSSHEAPKKVILSSMHDAPENAILSINHAAPEHAMQYSSLGAPRNTLSSGDGAAILSSSHMVPEEVISSSGDEAQENVIITYSHKAQRKDVLSPTGLVPTEITFSYNDDTTNDVILLSRSLAADAAISERDLAPGDVTGVSSGVAFAQADVTSFSGEVAPIDKKLSSGNAVADFTFDVLLSTRSISPGHSTLYSSGVAIELEVLSTHEALPADATLSVTEAALALRELRSAGFKSDRGEGGNQKSVGPMKVDVSSSVTNSFDSGVCLAGNSKPDPRSDALMSVSATSSLSSGVSLPASPTTRLSPVETRLIHADAPPASVRHHGSTTAAAAMHVSNSARNLTPADNSSLANFIGRSVLYFGGTHQVPKTSEQFLVLMWSALSQMVEPQCKASGEANPIIKGLPATQEQYEACLRLIQNRETTFYPRQCQPFEIIENSPQNKGKHSQQQQPKCIWNDDPLCGKYCPCSRNADITRQSKSKTSAKDESKKTYYTLIGIPDSVPDMARCMSMVRKSNVRVTLSSKHTQFRIVQRTKVADKEQGEESAQAEVSTAAVKEGKGISSTSANQTSEDIPGVKHVLPMEYDRSCFNETHMQVKKPASSNDADQTTSGSRPMPSPVAPYTPAKTLQPNGILQLEQGLKEVFKKNTRELPEKSCPAKPQTLPQNIPKKSKFNFRVVTVEPEVQHYIYPNLNRRHSSSRQSQPQKPQSPKNKLPAEDRPGVAGTAASVSSDEQVQVVNPEQMSSKNGCTNAAVSAAPVFSLSSPSRTTPTASTPAGDVIVSPLPNLSTRHETQNTTENAKGFFRDTSQSGCVDLVPFQSIKKVKCKDFVVARGTLFQIPEEDVDHVLQAPPGSSPQGPDAPRAPSSDRGIKAPNPKNIRETDASQTAPLEERCPTKSETGLDEPDQFDASADKPKDPRSSVVVRMSVTDCNLSSAMAPVPSKLSYVSRLPVPKKLATKKPDDAYGAAHASGARDPQPRCPLNVQPPVTTGRFTRSPVQEEIRGKSTLESTHQNKPVTSAATGRFTCTQVQEDNQMKSSLEQTLDCKPATSVKTGRFTCVQVPEETQGNSTLETTLRSKPVAVTAGRFTCTPVKEDTQENTSVKRGRFTCTQVRLDTQENSPLESVQANMQASTTLEPTLQGKPVRAGRFTCTPVQEITRENSTLEPALDCKPVAPVETGRFACTPVQEDTQANESLEPPLKCKPVTTVTAGRFAVTQVQADTLCTVITPHSPADISATCKSSSAAVPTKVPSNGRKSLTLTSKQRSKDSADARESQRASVQKLLPSKVAVNIETTQAQQPKMSTGFTGNGKVARRKCPSATTSTDIDSATTRIESSQEVPVVSAKPQAAALKKQDSKKCLQRSGSVKGAGTSVTKPSGSGTSGHLKPASGAASFSSKTVGVATSFSTNTTASVVSCSAKATRVALSHSSKDTARTTSSSPRDVVSAASCGLSTVRVATSANWKPIGSAVSPGWNSACSLASSASNTQDNASVFNLKDSAHNPASTDVGNTGKTGHRTRPVNKPLMVNTTTSSGSQFQVSPKSTVTSKCKLQVSPKSVGTPKCKRPANPALSNKSQPLETAANQPHWKDVPGGASEGAGGAKAGARGTSSPAGGKASRCPKDSVSKATLSPKALPLSVKSAGPNAVKAGPKTGDLSVVPIAGKTGSKTLDITVVPNAARTGLKGTTEDVYRP